MQGRDLPAGHGRPAAELSSTRTLTQARPRVPAGAHLCAMGQGGTGHPCGAVHPLRDASPVPEQRQVIATGHAPPTRKGPFELPGLGR
jgi:hypothetical protein